MAFQPRFTSWGGRYVAALALVVLGLSSCGDDDGGGGVEFFPPGGVSEEMRQGQSHARLNLEHTAVTVLEPMGGHEGDSEAGEGIDDFAYHFEEETEVRLSVGEFDEAPILIALDGLGNQIARVDSESGDAVVSLFGEHVFRFIHPRAGDADAEPIAIFFQPILAAEAGEALTSGANPNDVATLKADKSCFRCDLKGLSWNACPGVSLSGINLSNSDFTSAVLACQTFEPQGSTPVLLTGANFTAAKLSTVVMKGVELTDAKFTGAIFDVMTFDGVTATSADFSNSRFMNSIFGAAKGSGSFAPGANFSGAQIIENSCLSAYDLRGADFTAAYFDSTSSVHGTWFAGANMYDVTFDGAKFAYNSDLPDCGEPTSCTTVTVDGHCTNCPCTADLGCLDLSGATSCVENQGPVTLASQAVCQRGTVQAAAEGVTIQNATLTDVSFNGADLTGSTFVSNAMDSGNDFDGAVLHGVDFTQQDLGKAVDLSHAHLDDATNFAGAVLTDAPSTQRGVILSCVPSAGTGGCMFATQTEQFKGADMRYAELENVGLSEANLEGVNLSGASLVGADLNFVSLKNANLDGATLGAAPGSGTAASLRGAFMIDVNLTDTDLRSVDFTGAHVYGANSQSLFTRAKLDSADFTNAILSEGNFSNASMTATTFNGAQLVNATFDDATLTNAKFDDAYLQGADFSTASSVTGMSLSNAAVSTNLTSTMCDLVAPGTWMYMEQDGTPYTYQFGATMLQTDTGVVCPDNVRGPCTTGDSLCPVSMGPNPPVPPCVPTREYCYENCLTPPCFKDMPDPTTGECPLVSNCS